MIVLGLTTFFVTTLLAGYGATMLLLRKPAQIGAAMCICLSWLFGTGAVSLLLWIAGAFLHGIALSIAVSAVCVTLGICGWLRARSGTVTFHFEKPAGTGEWLLFVILTIEIIFACFVCWTNPLGWDGSFNWENKARIAFLSGGSIPAGYYSSPSQTLSHPEYPLLIPFTELWLYLCVGQAHQFLAKIIFPIFFATIIVLVAAFGSRLSRRRWAGVIAAALLIFVPAVVRYSGGVASGYVDLPLSAFYLAAVGYLLLFDKTGDTNMFRLSAAALTFLPWIKIEGAILWLIGAGCVMIICWRRKQILVGLVGILPGAILVATWQLFLHRMSANPSHDFVSVNASTLWANIDRVPAIALAAFKELGHLNNWSLFWLLVLIAGVYRFARTREQHLIFLTSAIALPIAAYSASYVFSSWPNFQDHLVYSLGRLLLHITPIGALCIALALPLPEGGMVESTRLPAKTI